MSGWVKLHRKMYENPRSRDPEWVAVWVYLLAHATHKPYRAIFMGNDITLQPGQLITGRKSIARATGVSESKVFRILKTLKTEHQIEQQTSSISSLLSICKWSEYQDTEHQSEQQVNSKRTAGEHKQEYKEYREILKLFPVLDNGQFHKAWEDKAEHRKELGLKPYREKGMKTLFSKMSRWGCSRAIEAIYKSISANHQGVFEPNAKTIQHNRDTGTLNDGVYAGREAEIDALF